MRSTMDPVVSVWCRLCMETVKKYTHVQKLSENEYSLLLKVESDKSACICYSCSKQNK